MNLCYLCFVIIFALKGKIPSKQIFFMKLFKVNFVVRKVKRLKSENKYLHLLTHPCIPSKEGNNGIYFLIYSVIDLLLYV